MTRAMIQQLREGSVVRRPPVMLKGDVECDEVYVVAGHKGHPEAVKKRPSSPTAAPEGGTWPGDPGEGEAADLRDVAAGRCGGDPDAGERQAGDDRPPDPADDHRGEYGLHR